MMIVVAFALLLGGLVLTACGQGSATHPASAPTPAANSSAPASAVAPSAPTAASQGASTLDGQSLMQQRCTVCHSTDRITSAHFTAAQWTATVNRMISHGAQLSQSEETVLVNYLAQNYHP